MPTSNSIDIGCRPPSVGVVHEDLELAHDAEEVGLVDLPLGVELEEVHEVLDALGVLLGHAREGEPQLVERDLVVRPKVAVSRRVGCGAGRWVGRAGRG